jgi:hypothetical protein
MREREREMATKLQVNDEEGNPLGNVRVGDTKLHALERLSRARGLFDKEDVGLLHTDMITSEGGPYVFKETQLPAVLQWFCVTGTIERPKSTGSAGDRFKLVQLARGGYYPLHGGIEDAFQCQAHPDEDELRLMSVRVVFLDENSADYFIADVNSYVTKSSGVVFCQGQDFRNTAIDPFKPRHLFLENHYKPREADEEAPKDSPVWNVEINSMDFSAVTSYSTFDDSNELKKQMQLPDQYRRERTYYQ